MSTQIAIRLTDAEIEALDAEVASGNARSRSDAVRRSIALLQRAARYRAEDEILANLARRGEPVYPDLTPWHGIPHPNLD